MFIIHVNQSLKSFVHNVMRIIFDHAKSKDHLYNIKKKEKKNSDITETISPCINKIIHKLIYSISLHGWLPVLFSFSSPQQDIDIHNISYRHS